MTSERHSRVKDVFLEACDLDMEERAAFLDRACAGDPTLRREVEDLLVHDEVPVDSSLGSAPDRIGSYRLLQKIGEGGMGEVWEAEQVEPIRRRVALKLIKWGMDTKEVVARFESERQALALMNHPNIAKVFEAGSTGRGPALLRHGVRQRRAAHGILRQPPPEHPGAVDALHAGLRRSPARPPEGHHPPRYQTFEYPGHASRATGRCPRSSTSASPRRPPSGSPNALSSPSSASGSALPST